MKLSTSKRRNKGEGSITTLPNGKLKMTITIGRGIDGKQKRKVVTASTRKELLDKASEVRLKYKVGNYKELINTNITFLDYAKEWLKKKEFSVAYNTIKDYSDIISYCSYLHDIQLQKITKNDIDNVLLSFKNLSSATIQHRKTVIGSLFNSAIDEEIITQSPMRGTIKTAKRRKKVDLAIPTEDEAMKILKKAKDISDKYQGDGTFKALIYPFLLLAVTTGMRRGELAGLKWENIDFEKNKIKIDTQITNRGKNQILKTNSSYRTISVAPEVLEVIKQYEDVDNPFVFVYKKNKSAESLLLKASVLTKKIFRELKLNEELTLHSLRHYHATQLIKNHINVKVVCKRLGHSNIKITLDFYVHYLPSMDEEASKIVGKNYVLI